MTRVCSTVTTNKDVPSLVGRDETKVLRLRLSTLANASGDTALELVRTSHSPVAVLEVDGKADRVSDAVTAPSGTNTRLDGAKTLAVRLVGTMGSQPSVIVAESEQVRKRGKVSRAERGRT